MSAMTCRCGVDVHAHVVPENFPAYLGRARCSDLATANVTSRFRSISLIWMEWIL